MQFIATEYALLVEHVGFHGSRLVLQHTQDTSDLRAFGWNDVASAAQTWGPLPVAGPSKPAISQI